MGTIGKRILTVAVGLLLAAGVPYLAATTLHADPGSGHKCESPCGEKSDCGHGGKCGCESPCGEKADCGQGKGCGDCGGRHGKHEGMHGKEGGQMPCKKMTGGPPMKEGMAGHMEETRGTIAKLRALEAKMEALKSKDDAVSFRATSLEHSKLLTDLQASHLKHMEGMMGGK